MFYFTFRRVSLIFVEFDLFDSLILGDILSVDYVLCCIRTNCPYCSFTLPFLIIKSLFFHTVFFPQFKRKNFFKLLTESFEIWPLNISYSAISMNKYNSLVISCIHKN